MFGDVLGGPVTEEGVQKALVSTIKRSRSDGMVDKLFIGVQVRPEDKHAGVEAVWPASIWRRGQLFAVE